MTQASRREFLAGTTALPLAAMALPAGAQAPASVAEDLRLYVGFGGKQAGGEGDNRCGEWLEAELRRSGFAVERQGVSVPVSSRNAASSSAGKAGRRSGRSRS